MTPNNNLSPLPFYKSLDEQNHRKSYAYGDIYPLFASAARLIPFQILRAHDTNYNVGTCWLHRKDGSTVSEIRTKLIQGGLQILPFQDAGVDVIVYPAGEDVLTNIPDGIYYLEVNDAYNTYYSDMFTVVQDMTPYLKIEWRDAEDLYCEAGVIAYASGYWNTLYFCTELGKPDYEFEEEGDSRDGYFFPEKQISYKTYRFTILAPEYLCDVMRLIRMSDVIEVTDKYGNEYLCNSFLITPKWQVQGNLASIEVEFTTNTVVKKIGRGYRFTGDFNDDFNRDFKI